MSLRRQLLILGILSFACLLRAQDFPLRFDHLSLEQGISHNLVYAIHQDQTGFMWFGTMYGLVKYDGRRYTIYRHDPNDAHSISYNDIIAIYEDQQGYLWIGTWGGGLNRFDPLTEKFTRFMHDPANPASLSNNMVWAIAEDEHGRLWLGTDHGLDRLHIEKGFKTGEATDSSLANATFVHYQFSSFANDKIEQTSVRALLKDSCGRLWAGAIGGGLNLLDTTREDFLRFKHEPANAKSLSRNAVNSIYEDRAGNLWIGTIGGGLNRLVFAEETTAETKTLPSPERAEFVHYVHEPDNPHSLSQNEIGPLVEDRNGNLWVGTMGGGLNRFDPATGRILRVQRDPAQAYSLSSNVIVALCEDRSGILWIGSYQGGVDKLDPYRQQFQHVREETVPASGLSYGDVRAICQDRSGAIWVGTFGGGLTQLSPEGRRMAQFNADAKTKTPAALLSNFITSIIEDKQGYLWIGALRGGLCEFDPKRKTFFYYSTDAKNPQSLSHDNVNVVYEDRAGTLWVGTDGGGLNRFDRARKQFTRFQHEAADSASLSSDFIHAIAEDHDGNLWLGTYAGLNKLDRQTQTFERYRHRLADPASLSNDYVYAIHLDSAGNIWAGTSDGLSKLQRPGNTFKNYTEADGLPNGVICGILEDEAGGLWLSTKKGLTHFDTRTETFRNYDISDGLQSNMFNIGAYFKNENDEMFWGGINGINRFHPAAAVRNTFAPPVALTSLKIFDKAIAFQQIQRNGEALRLPHDRNFLTFEFAALNYSHPEKNEYAYRLEGLDRDWIYSGTQNTASYTGLQSGAYVFRVKGSNGEGVWNENGASLKIIIAPPFWRTWWFYSAAGLAFVLLITIWHHARLRQERERAAEIARIKNEEQLARFQAVAQAKQEERERVRKQIAADFHDESGHKLTKISLFCGVLQSRLHQNNRDIDDYLSRIMNVAASLHKDMSDFIWSLDPEESTLHDTALKLKDFGDKLFDRTGIRFCLTGLGAELEHTHLSMETRQNLTCIFKEGMNNILKHTRENCRNVTCAFARENGGYSVTLLDDGKGFEVGMSPRGKGLRNMQARAAAIQGELQIISRPGKGTAIQFSGRLNQPQRFEPHKNGNPVRPQNGKTVASV